MPKLLLRYIVEYDAWTGGFMRKQKRFFFAAGFAVLSVFSWGGCGALLSDANTQKAGVGLTQGIVDALSKDPKLQQAAQQAVRNILQGTAADWAKLVDEAMRLLVESAKKHGAPALREMQPELEQAVRKLMEAAVLSASATVRKSAQTDLNAATQMLVQTAAKTFFSSLTQFLQGWDEKAAHWLDEKLAPAVAKMARTAAKEAVLGFQDGMQEPAPDGSQALRPPTKEFGLWLGEGIGEGIVRSVSKDPQKRGALAIATVVLGILLGLNLIVLLWMVRKYWMATKSLVLFIHQAERFPGRDGDPAQSFLAQVHAAHKVAKHDGWLRRFMIHRGLISPGE